jgi:hypothetical protein
MFEVSPFIEKLEKLKEYIGMTVDGLGNYIMFNTDAFNNLRPSDVLDLWAQTGILVYRGGGTQEIKKLSFEEWYSPLKTELQVNL